jgi:uncharacterized cysteine cluster protein YcgN (CxxCxxCC family)
MKCFEKEVKIYCNRLGADVYVMEDSTIGRIGSLDCPKFNSEAKTCQKYERIFPLLSNCRLTERVFKRVEEE